MESIKELRRICQEPKGKEPWYITNVRRRASIYITKLFLKLGITANQTTFISIVIGVVGVILFAFGNYWYTLSAVFLLHISSILDCTDGEIARYRGPSPVGAFFDSLFHDIMYGLTFVGISFGVYQNYPNILVFALGFSASVFKMLHRLTSVKKGYYVKKLEDTPYKPKKESGEPVRSPLIKFLSSPVIKKPVFYVYSLNAFGQTLPLLLIAAIFDLMPILLLFYGIFIPLVWFVSLYTAYRDLRIYS